MPGFVRLGDICTGHSTYPSRPSIEASPDTFVDNIQVCREGDHWASHTNQVFPFDSHDSVGQATTTTIFVNNKKVLRIGDPIVCGGATSACSPDCFGEDVVDGNRPGSPEALRKQAANQVLV